MHRACRPQRPRQLHELLPLVRRALGNSPAPRAAQTLPPDIGAHTAVDRCVYTGPLTPQIRAVKVFSLSSSVAGVIAQPIIIKEAANIGSTSLLVAMCSVVGFFTFVTPLLLHLITKKYVTRMDYDPLTSTYTATTISFFLAKKELQFKTEDVVVPEVPGMFTSFIAKGKSLFVEPRHFEDPIHYAKLMGYDKPMDFKLGTDEDTKEK